MFLTFCRFSCSPNIKNTLQVKRYLNIHLVQLSPFTSDHRPLVTLTINLHHDNTHYPTCFSGKQSAVCYPESCQRYIQNTQAPIYMPANIFCVRPVNLMYTAAQLNSCMHTCP